MEENKTPEELEKQLLSITDSHDLTDSIQKGEKVILFRCAGSGLYFPGDYLELWGRKYGHGLGRHVVSECLETDWYSPVAIPQNLRTPTQIMFPMKQGEHQVDAAIMSQKEAQRCKPAVLQINDPYYDLIAKIIRDKQLANRNGRLNQIVFSQNNKHR